MLSRRFIEAVKLSTTPAYRLALNAGIHPTLLSKWVIGAQPARKGDERLIRIGRLLGLEPHEVFQENEQSNDE